MDKDVSESPYTTKEAVHNRAKDAIGKPMRALYKSFGVTDAEVDQKINQKNFVGDAFECWMKIPKNSRAGADMEVAGVELKATPFKLLKNGQRSAKERLVLNIINYMDEAKRTFETSSFEKKDKLMELAFYLYDRSKTKDQWAFAQTILFAFPEKDLEIIKNDWETIHRYIMEGRANELNEGLTNYLSAATKGASSKTVRQQPFSDIPAKQRAYTLKASYMTSILRDYVFGDKTDKNIQKDYFTTKTTPTTATTSTQESIATIKELTHQTLEEIILNKLNAYQHKDVNELCDMFNITNRKAKSIYAMLVSRMLGLHGNAENAEEIEKAGIKIKTIRVDNGVKGCRIKESMSFPAFKFKQIINEDWEDSDLYDHLTHKFLFVVFKQTDKQTYEYMGSKFWFMSNGDLDTAAGVWDDTREKIKHGVKLSYDAKRDRITNNFIKVSDKRIISVRPHAQKASYENDLNADELPTPFQWATPAPTNKNIDPSHLFMTKQCFWLNSNYVLAQISDLLK